MKRTRKNKIAIITISTFILLYLISPQYVKKSLIHFFPGIDDYKIFHNRTVDTGTPKPWPKAYDYMQYQLQQQERDTLDHYNSVAYLIIQNDSIVYEEYWDGYSQNSLSNIFSAAKSIVGLLIGAAIDDGYIKSEDQFVYDFIPEYKNQENEILKIKHLLTMSSGLNWNENYLSPFSDPSKAYYGNNVNQLVLDLKVIDAPGIDFSYKSGNTQLLAVILERATGKTISEYASEKLWKPLGAVQPALWSLDRKNGNEKAFCCFNSNARDLAKIGQLILHNGIIDSVQIISKEYIAKSIKPAKYLINSEDNSNVDFYGYQWWIMNVNGESIPYARGIYGQYIFVLKEQNAIVVRLGQKRSFDKVKHHPSDVYSYVNTAMRILSNRNK